MTAGAALVVASNRGPDSFVRDEAGRLVAAGAGGLASSLVSALEGRDDAVWVCAGDGENGPVQTVDVPDEVAGMAYHVISNSTLWFLQHGLFERARRPVLDARWHAAWDGYREYNRLFAARIAEAAAPQGTVLVHDYHLMLVGRELAQTRPDLRTLHFSHTPFCEPDDLALLPDGVARELMASMVSFGACGFHSSRWAAAFGRCAAAVTAKAPATVVSPLAPDAARLAAATTSAGFAERRSALEDRLAGRLLILRSDRVELSKNLGRGFLAFDELLARRPEWRGRVVFIALAYPSRTDMPEYLAYRSEMEHLVSLVNERWSSPGYEPLVLDVADDYLSSVAALSRYDALLVNPIKDGLNLVAKEGPLLNNFAGVLALSREAGAFEELSGGALEVNPYDVAGTAAVLEQALSMAADERERRALLLKEIISRRNPRAWLDELIDAARTPRP
jgi:trehalose 6-phosphate synthase